MRTTTPPTERLPQLSEAAVAWDLRTAWALGREVALSLRRGQPVRGYVEYVASSNAFALIWDGDGELHVPCVLVRAVRQPHYHEPGWGPPVAARPGRGLRAAVELPGQLSFPLRQLGCALSDVS